MYLVPISLKQENGFVTMYHRHHGAVQGCKFCEGVVDDNETIRGIAIVGRPVSRHLDDGKTVEITRLCTDGYKNACSFLYAACARIARTMGFKRIMTYILCSENGVSLRAAGWICGGICGGGNWNTKTRPRKDSKNQCKKLLYYKDL